MSLEQSLAELGEEDPRALPAISRRYGARREALLVEGDKEAVMRLDRALGVVSSHYWSAVEPMSRSRDERREGPPVGAYPPGDLRTFSAEDLDRMPVKAPGPVTLAHRQGVFVHSFKCSLCDLEFVLFSWRANRHRVGTTFCPECGERTPMIHWRTQTSDSLDFRSDGPGREIYQMCPQLDGPLMDDSMLPPEDRYTFPDDRPDPSTSG